MNEDILFFFRRHMDALPLYEAFEELVRKEIEDVEIKVQKSQISFYKKHMFACVSFAGVRRKRDCPAVYIVVTIGLNHKLDSPRIEVSSEPYPGRWTHHLLLSNMEELDKELLTWLKEAAAFAEEK